jgi:hypothetical protein
VVRDAVARRLDQAAADRIDAAYRSAYGEHPETPDELRRAQQTARRLTGEEPWAPRAMADC